MTRIVTNSLLNSTKRYISNRKNTFITSDGPNDTGMKIGLEDFGIPYDTHYRSRIVLPANTQDYFLNYGILENVTFLLIKVTYNGNYDNGNEDDFDPYYYYDPSTSYNITYYYEGNSGVTYPIGRLLLLNGSLTNKLTKIYLNNPLDYDVVLDVLQANISEPIPAPASSAVTITNLYYNDIITDQVVCSGTSTGSTSFIINYLESIYTGYTNTQLIILYSDILSFTKDANINVIYLYTKNNTYTLKFLTDIDCNQAYDRMFFVFASYLYDTCRYLTEDNAYDNSES